MEVNAATHRHGKAVDRNGGTVTPTQKPNDSFRGFYDQNYNVSSFGSTKSSVASDDDTPIYVGGWHY